MNEWHNAEHHAEKAHQLYEAGQWVKALAELKLALAVNPQQSDWHFGMGLTLEALERYDEAIESYQQVLQLRGDDVEAMLHLAAVQVRSNRAQQATETLEHISRIDPTNEASYNYRIAAYTQLGDHEMAEQMFYLAQQVNENSPQSYDHVALSLAIRGDFDRAIWCWQKVFKLDPQHPDVHANLARAHWQKGQLDRASHLFILQLREDPGDIDILLQLGNLLIEMNRYTQAREKFIRILELDPTITDAHLHLGELSLVAGQLEAAAAELEMASRLAPDRPGVHLCLAKVAQRRGNASLVRMHLLAEHERRGQTPPQSLELAKMLIENRLPEQAVGVLTPLIEGKHDPFELDQEHLAQAMLYRGVAYILDHKIQAGITQCRRALQITPRNIMAMQHLIAAHLVLGQRRRAGYWLERATDLQPNDPQLKRLKWRLRWARLAAPVAKLANKLSWW